MSKDLENFKEMISLIPAMRQAVRTGLERDMEDHVHDIDRIHIELKFLKQSFILFRKKWTYDIIYVIRHLKTPYFNEIKKVLPKINSRSLTDRLRLLEKKGLVNRKVHNSQPYRVSYELTDFGRGAYELLLPLLYYFVLPEKYRKLK
ncbi:MAG: winged helix-turn-helix transcriptional regulator [Candidatus Hermodarchaeota archaeon]